MTHEAQNNENENCNMLHRLAQQHTFSEGGIKTDLTCPSCREEVFGIYLPTFKCPHCEIMIWRDETGNITNYENQFACPECGRGTSMESAKAMLIDSLVSGFHAILLFSMKMDGRAASVKPNRTLEVSD